MFENIGWFEVSMNNSIFDEGLKGVENLQKELNGLIFCKNLLRFEVAGQVPLVAVLHDEVEVI